MNWSRLKTRDFAGDAPFSLSRVSFIARAELTGLTPSAIYKGAVAARVSVDREGERERRDRPLCHLMARQQTWQELQITPVIEDAEAASSLAKVHRK